MIGYSPVFMKSIEAVPDVFRRRLSLPSSGRSQIDSTIFSSREAVINAIKKSGDPVDLFPFIGLKLSSFSLAQEAYNQHMLKREGIIVAESEKSVKIFYGRQVQLDMECFFFSNDRVQVLELIQQLMFLSSELQFSMKFDDHSFECKIKIETSGISFPEADFQAVSSIFELQFPVTLLTWSGVVKEIPKIDKINAQGGLLVETDYSGKIERRVERAINIGVAGDTSTNEIIQIEVDLAQDEIDPNRPLSG